MEPRSTKEIVAGWWLYLLLASGSRAERKALEMGEPIAAVAASEALFDRMSTGGVAAVDLVLALLEAAPDEDGYIAVGAGPLDNLVGQHGDALADALAEAARREPAFAVALRVVLSEVKSIKARDTLSPWLDPA